MRPETDDRVLAKRSLNRDAPRPFLRRIERGNERIVKKPFPYSFWFSVEPNESVVIAALYQRRNEPVLSRRKPSR